MVTVRQTVIVVALIAMAVVDVGLLVTGHTVQGLIYAPFIAMTAYIGLRSQHG